VQSQNKGPRTIAKFEPCVLGTSIIPLLYPLEEVKIIKNVMNYSNVVFVFENTSPATISPLQLEGPYKRVRYMHRRGRVLMLTHKMRDHQ